MRGSWLVVRLFLLWCLLGFVAGVSIVVVAPIVLGDSVALTVMSGSMTPTIDAGDVVIDRRIPVIEARIGDIVTFANPSGDGTLLTHRIRDVRAGDGVVHVETRGDANDNPERWTISETGTVGLVEHRLPRLGFALTWARTPAGRVALVSIPAALLAVLFLVAIWRPALPRRGTDAET